MQPLQRTLAKIPLVDLRGHTPLELLFLFRRQAFILAEGALASLGAARLLAIAADRASHRWLEKAQNPYLTEITLIAEALNVPGAYLLNTCLEWGCTSGGWQSEDGPLSIDCSRGHTSPYQRKGQRREPAPGEVRFVSERIGWLPFAGPSC